MYVFYSKLRTPHFFMTMWQKDNKIPGWHFLWKGGGRGWGGGEGGRSFPRTKYITGTYLKVFLRLVSLRHFVFLWYQTPSLPFQRRAFLKRRTHVSIQKNKDGLREMAPISVPRGWSTFPLTKYSDHAVVLHQVFMHHCVFLLYF